MKNILASILLISAFYSQAAPIFTNTTVVLDATNEASFSDIMNGDDLSLYVEDGLNVFMEDTAFIGPFVFFGEPAVTGGLYYGTGGNLNWVLISMVDNSRVNALDFMIGDGFSNQTTNLIWETFDGAVSTGFGDIIVNKGSSVGWTDMMGFTSIRVAASPSLDSFGDYQAIAMDDLRVSTSIVNNVSTPAHIALFGLSLLGLAAFLRNK